MDTTITGIGAVAVAGLRSAGYMESTIGQYEKTIRDQGAERLCATARHQHLHSGVGCRVRVFDDQPAHGPVQRPAQARLSAAGGGFRLLPGNRPGRPVGS